MLLVTLLYVAGISCLYAQTPTVDNLGKNPYLDSKHAYSINVGLKDNNRTWHITNRLEGDALIDYDLEDSGNSSWATLSAATVNGGAEIVSIFFDREKFTTGDWYLQCSEFQDIDGTKQCVSAREFKITITENTFYLTLGDDGSVKNSQHEVEHKFDEVDADDNKYSTTINNSSASWYSVTMHKADNFKPDSWSFTATFDQTVTPANSCAATVSEGSVSVSDAPTAGDNSYTITVTGPFTSNEVTVSFSVTFNEPVHKDVAPKLTVTNGLAMVNGSPVAETKDNITQYPVSPATPGDREQQITVLALPTPHDITSEEPDWSAKFPLQNSTHSYKVQMGATTNVPVVWRILDADKNVLANDENANYEYIASGVVGTEATVSFKFKMAPDTYYIEYRETDADVTKATTAVRRYPITIQAPFDADITAATDICAAISNKVNNLVGDPLALQPTETTVTYTVTLNNDDYCANWSFKTAITGNPALGNDATADLRIKSITAVTAGLTYDQSTQTFTVTNTAKAGETGSLKNVSFSVTYEGLYASEHEITTTISDITGAYGETEANPSEDDNKTVHTIYSLPQPGQLAGVD